MLWCFWGSAIAFQCHFRKCVVADTRFLKLYSVYTRVWIIYSFLFLNKWLMWLLFVCELKSSCEWLSCVSASSVFHDATRMGLQTECTSESEGASHCVLLLDRRVRGWQCDATRINWTTPLIQSTVEWIQWNTAKLINHLAWLTLLLSSQLL